MEDSFEDLYALRTRRLKASAIREICKLAAKPEVISLAGGWPDPSTFPVKETLEIIRDILESNSSLVLQYGTSEGVPQLREFLAQWARKKEQLEIDADNIILTSGSQQGMELASKVLIDAGDVVMVGLPTYFGGTGAFLSYQAQLVGIPLDEKGMRMHILEQRLHSLQRENKRIKLVYVQPNFQNPSGATLPLERRQKLLDLAERFNFLILEDNPYGDIRYEGEWIPSLKSLDTYQRVIYLRSFSKIFSPGIRLAWVAGEKALIRKMVIAKQFEDCCTNTISQYLLLEFCKRGYLEPQIARNIAYYQRKRDLMLEALEKYFPQEIQWNRPQGGFFIFLTLPPRLDAEDLLREAITDNVAFVAGAPFFIDGSGRNTMRLSFAQSSEERIEEAIKRLSCILESRLKG